LTAALDAELGGLRAQITRGGGLEEFLTALLGMEAGARRDLTRFTLARAPVLEKQDPQYTGEWRAAAWFAELYPNDPAVIAPLYLNLLDLAPGEAVYLPAGVLHAYVEGFGVELMANSDNVLRGGLTPKHVDVEELKRILQFTPFKPEILKPVPQGTSAGYDTDCREFALSVIRGGTASGAAVPAGGPAIALVTQGKARFSWDTEELVLGPGESAFIAPRHAGEMTITAADNAGCTVYLAEPGVTA
jgi:mannose-6-phosphate isomerase